MMIAHENLLIGTRSLRRSRWKKTTSSSNLSSGREHHEFGADEEGRTRGNEIMGSFPIWTIVKDEIEGGDAVTVKGNILHCHREKMTVDLHLLVIV